MADVVKSLRASIILLMIFELNSCISCCLPGVTGLSSRISASSLAFMSFPSVPGMMTSRW